MVVVLSVVAVEVALVLIADVFGVLAVVVLVPLEVAEGLAADIGVGPKLGVALHVRPANTITSTNTA